jgi:diguanylate cyclase (GGDEF)-like protein/PAS domain S-box-containing protein
MYPSDATHPDVLAKRQALRLRRFFMAALSAAVTFLMMTVLYLQGLMARETLVHGAVATAVGLLFFFVAFRRGWNLKSRDPSLTGPMILMAAALVFWLMYESPAVRATMDAYLCVIMLFGVFRYSTRVLLRIAAAFLIAYALMLTLVWAEGRAGDDLALDAGRLIVMCCVLPLIAWVGGRINALRNRLHDGKEFFRKIWDACNDAVLVIDTRGIIRYANPAMQAIFGHDPATAIGSHVGFLQPPGLPAGQNLAGMVVGKAPATRVIWETEGVRRDGSRLPLEATLSGTRLGGENMAVAFLADISKRRMAEEQIRHLANHDPLTGLPNRGTMDDRLQQAIASTARHGGELWVLFLDFDRFKLINDSLGHRYGDIVLTTMAARLKEACRETDTVARLGGDEFVLLLAEPPGGALSVRLIERLMQNLAQPIWVNGQALLLTSSIGIAVYPEDGDSAERLVEHADIAMYRAKQDGRNRFCFYTPSMNDAAIARLQMEGDLRHALEKSEFLLHYQPQADLDSGEIVGAEALLRWQHPSRGIVPPAEFIPMAEDTGLIVPIGEWVIRSACLQQRAWRARGMKPLRVAVNLSPRQFAQKDLVATVARILDDTGMAAAELELEITESTVMHDVEHAVRQLRELKALGVHLSIDDFGTGHSSLAYLKRFPIDILKIDRSFIKDIARNGDGGAIATAIITLAQALKLQVVAEGVETQEQLDYLRRARCHRMQGFLLSRPLAPPMFERTVGLQLPQAQIG